jgi:hypothetical protein
MSSTVELAFIRQLSHTHFFASLNRIMLKEDQRIDKNSPGSLAKSILKELILYAFMAVSVVITIFIALDLRSWWPFAAWFAVVLAFGFWLGD